MSSTKSAPSRFNQGPGRPAQARQGSSHPSLNTGGSSSKRKETSQKFKRIRGLLTGESRRERKVKKEQEAKVAAAAGKKPPVADLQVILLLIDPKTRRFELLQLGFDSHKAVVRDVLSQIPHSVTEEALRKQKYTGVCDRTGQELYYSTRLADVCNGSDILIALPSTVEAGECAIIAKPILQDINVIEMLRASGVDVASLEKREVPPSPKKPLTADTRWHSGR